MALPSSTKFLYVILLDALIARHVADMAIASGHDQMLDQSTKSQRIICIPFPFWTKYVSIIQDY